MWNRGAASASLKGQDMPSYKTHDPRGYCGDPARGAAMGRATIRKGAPSGKLTLRRIRINSDGYDANGTYWGLSSINDLYWYADAGENLDGTVWAKDREDAKREVLLKHPGVEFLR